MTEWTVVTVIIALVGLFMTVGKPLINLNKNITTLNINLENVTKRVDKNETELHAQSEKASESHKGLWKKSGEQDDKLADHEVRISVLEKK